MFTSKTTLRDMELIRKAAASLLWNAETLPISYKIGGKQYRGIPAEFPVSLEKRLIDANICERRYTARITGTPLEIRVECFEYRDSPVCEWTAYFTNRGDENSPVISDFYGCELCLPTDGEAVLWHNNGDFCSAEGLETKALTLKQGESFTAASVNGRSCDKAWPYYRITCEGYGYNLAIGWPGNWCSKIEKREGGVYFGAKQEYTNFYLKPGETVRSPRMVAMAFDKDSDRGINLWRRWMFAHNVPRTRGNMLEPKKNIGFGGGGEEFTLASEENQKKAITAVAEHGGDLSEIIWWIDAGWYPCKDENGVKRWVRIGDWRPDPEKFPNGLAPVGELCDEHGIQLLLWFEPERVMLKYWPEDNPKDYVLTLKKPTDSEWLKSNGLLWLGNPECRRWLTDKVKKIMAEGKVKIYRQDFNGCPFPLNWWLENDEGEDRCGITENLHIQGYLQFWDDLLFDIPDLWIDSCASGGRRNDIEAMRRAVALHPTDFGYGNNPVQQAFKKTWFEWTPYFRNFAATWDDEEGNYTEEGRKMPHDYCNFSAHVGFAPVMGYGPGPWDSSEKGKKLIAYADEFKKISAKAAKLSLSGDFFSLTPVRKSPEDYYAIQFQSYDGGEGVIQVIRNTRCEEEALTVVPRGLSAETSYRFYAPETDESFVKTGKELEGGFEVRIPKRSGIFWYYEAL